MRVEYDMTVKNIPSGLFTCFIDEKEIGIEEFSPKHIVFRYSRQQDANCTSVQFAYFVFERAHYEYLMAEHLHFICEEKKEYSFLYAYEVEDEKYEEMILFILSQYQQYIRLKLESFDNSFSHELVGYPAKEDELFIHDVKAWEKELESQYMTQQALWEKIRKYHIELAYPLENKREYKVFLSEDWDKDLFLGQVSRVYIGNSWCPHLFPSLDLLFDILDQAKRRELEITIVLPYLQEAWITKWQAALQKIYRWCCQYDKRIEVVVNDYGELVLLENMTEHIDICLGTLLNKRRKDPRYPYKKGFCDHVELLKDNMIQDGIYLQFLMKYKVRRIEAESCGYEMTLKNEKKLPTTLWMPYYQTNTSQYCPIYALCKNKDRGKQVYISECPAYCETYACVYPIHLSMISRYNSIFAFDSWLVKNIDVIDVYAKQGMDRILWNGKSK